MNGICCLHNMEFNAVGWGYCYPPEGLPSRLHGFQLSQSHGYAQFMPRNICLQLSALWPLCSLEFLF